MVRRAEFEKMIASWAGRGIQQAQDEAWKRYKIRFEAEIVWHITCGEFEDEPPETKGGVCG